MNLNGFEYNLINSNLNLNNSNFSIQRTQYSSRYFFTSAGAAANFDHDHDMTSHDHELLARLSPLDSPQRVW